MYARDTTNGRVAHETVKVSRPWPALVQAAYSSCHRSNELIFQHRTQLCAVTRRSTAAPGILAKSHKAATVSLILVLLLLQVKPSSGETVPCITAWGIGYARNIKCNTCDHTAKTLSEEATIGSSFEPPSHYSFPESCTHMAAVPRFRPACFV